MGEPTVLVLSDLLDATADAVIAELELRGVPVFCANPGDFPQTVTLAARLDGDGMTGTVRVRDRRHQRWRSLALGEVGCGYYRRPTAFRVPDGVPELWQFWAAREARHGFGGVISALPRWLNHPADIAYAEYKPVQLHYAAQAGLRIPRTIVTNDPKEAREFGGQVGQVVHKRLSGAVGPGDPFTHLVEPGDLDVADTAHLFQEWIDKDHEVRVTIVDDAVFAVRIDAHTDAAFVDWRADHDRLTYSVADVPPAVEVAMHVLMWRLRLRFTAFDFAVTPTGDWVFLEINPNGQWLWLQQHTGLPIAAAVATALQDAAGAASRPTVPPTEIIDHEDRT